MRVLVTGGAGFIGSHTVDLLLARGYAVRILDSLAPPVHQPGRVPDYVPLADVEFVQGDVRSRADWERALDQVDAVVHLAAYQDYLTDFSKFFHVNTVGTALLFEVIVERRLPVKKVVFASSQAVYGEGKHRCAADGVQYPEPRPTAQLLGRDWEPRCAACGEALAPLPTDEAVVKAHSQYALSKLTQEMIAFNLGRRYGIPVVGLRYSITQGPRQSFRNAYSGICRVFTLRLLADRPPVAYEDGLQQRDYVAVRDVARANLLALEDDRADYQALNVGGAEAVTVVEYARLVADVLGKRIEPVIPGEFRSGDTRHVISDSRRLRALGWRPVTPLRRTVEEYAAWVAAQPDARDQYPAAALAMKRQGVVREARC